MRIAKSLGNLQSLLQQLLRLNGGRAFLVTAVLWLTAFTICKYRYWRDPHSAFFSSDNVYDLHYSLHRQGEADAFIKEAGLEGTTLKKSKGKPEICAAFVTVKRDGIQYVDEAVGSLLAGLTDEEREKLYVVVAFADTETAKHPSWKQPWLANSVDELIGYNVTEKVMVELKEWEKDRNFYKKGVFDYLYGLKACYDTGASNVIMLEDDVILADGWMAKTQQALRIIESKSKNRKGDFWDWIYLRLFYTETSMQWEDTDFWYYHMWLTFSFASVIGFVVTRLMRAFAPSSRRYLDGWCTAVICLVTIPAFTALAFMIGKYSLFPPDTVFALNKHGCCTQALLFPRPEIPELIEYLQGRGHGQTDAMIEDYADGNGKQRLATGKQLVQHVGLTSSRDNTFVNSQSTWAFWFETQDKDVLRREHLRLAKSLK